MRDQLARLFKNRSGAVITGMVAAGIAVILLVVYLHSYRSSVNSGAKPERVLVAKTLIKQGTSATVIGAQNMYTVATIQKDQLQPFAIIDPSAIAGRVAAADILPGTQFVQADFTTETETGIPYQIVGNQRAIAIPVDAVHGLIGQIAAGNFVDIYASAGGDTGQLVKLVAADVYVLVAPGAGASDAIIRIYSKDAARFAIGADAAKYWLVLRPQVKAKTTPPETATLATLLANSTTGG